MVKIYYLESDGKIFYIGKTKNNLFLRVGKHREKFSNKYNNIKILLLDEVKEKEWKFWEQYWIEQFKSWGFHLENQNKGGGGPEKHKPESLRKMSENMKGRKLSKETISKIVQAKTGMKKSNLR